MTPSGAGEVAAEAPWPSARRAWYAVGVFGLALAINFLDRGILILLIGPIKHDMQLSDTMRAGTELRAAVHCAHRSGRGRGM